MTKRRVALISSCAPPLPGSPATGGGLRTEQLLETLRGAGHSVRLFVEAEALPAKAPKALREHSFTADSLEAQVRAFRPSIVVVEQWALVDRLGDLDKPLVIDLHGSLLLENVYRRGDLNLVMDAGTKIQALARADLLLVPASVQEHHFAAWATLAGFDPRELPIAVMPLAMAAPPIARTKKRPALRLVYGGARWPWIDSLDDLRTAADTVAAIEGARLDVFTYEPPRHGLPFEEDLGTWPEVDRILSGREAQGIRLHEATEHAHWQRFLLDEATVALDRWSLNPERMLAATTRSIEFLWAGLPVITVTGAAWAETLLASGAGWALPAGDGEALSALISELGAKPATLARASAAATSLVSQHHGLADAGRPLLEFCTSRQRPPRSRATLVEALVAVRESHLAEELRSLAAGHKDEHHELVAANRVELKLERGRHSKEVTALTAAHSEQVAALTAAHGEQVEALVEELRSLARVHRDEHQELIHEHKELIGGLEKRHKGEIRELVVAGRKSLKEAAGAAREETKGSTREHRAAMNQATAEHRVASAELSEEHRQEAQSQAEENAAALQERDRAAREQLEQVVAANRDEIKELSQTHREQVEERDRAAREQLEKVVAANRDEIKELSQTHREQAEERDRDASEQLEKVVAANRDEIKELSQTHREQAEERDRDAREQLEKVVAANHDEIKELSQTHREQVEALAAERQDEVQRLVGQARAELEQADERHRAEMSARIEELQAQLASQQRQFEEERARHDVELRAEMTARELELHQQMLARETELGELLALANRTLAQKVKDRLASSEGLGPLPGRLSPAARLARLWAEHAADRPHEEKEE